MGRPIDVSGQRYGRLVAQSWTGRVDNGGRVWRCLCDCGTSFDVSLGPLRSGNTSSCGCAARERIAGLNRTHGMSRTPEYQIWKSMIARCHRPTAQFYELYGGRGIVVCDAWRESFESFIGDVGPKPSPESEIDRIDNNGNYEPSNVRWASRKHQMRNFRRNRVIEHGEARLTLIEWSERTGIAHELIRARIDRLGWSVERALTTPARKGLEGEKQA